jgi:hypothetical protein
MISFPSSSNYFGFGSQSSIACDLWVTVSVGMGNGDLEYY